MKNLQIVLLTAAFLSLSSALHLDTHQATNQLAEKDQPEEDPKCSAEDRKTCEALGEPHKYDSKVCSCSCAEFISKFNRDQADADASCVASLGSGASYDITTCQCVASCPLLVYSGSIAQANIDCATQKYVLGYFFDPVFDLPSCSCKCPYAAGSATGEAACNANSNQSFLDTNLIRRHFVGDTCGCTCEVPLNKWNQTQLAAVSESGNASSYFNDDPAVCGFDICVPVSCPGFYFNVQRCRCTCRVE